MPSINNKTKIILLFGFAVVIAVVVVYLAFSSGKNPQTISPTPVGSSNVGGAYIPNNQGENSTDTSNIGQKTIGSVTVYGSVGGWRLAENFVAKVSIKLPDKWDISADQNTPYYLAGSLITDKSWATVYVNHYPNPQKLSLKKWVKNNLEISDFTDVTIGITQGVSYTENITNDEVAPYNSGTLVGLAVANGDEVITVPCSSGGAESLVSVCKDILNSFVLEK